MPVMEVIAGQPRTEKIAIGDTLTVSITAGSGAIVERIVKGSVAQKVTVSSSERFGPFADEQVIRVSCFPGSSATIDATDEAGSVASLVSGDVSPPSGFTRALPFTLLSCAGPGQAVTYPYDAITAAKAWNSAIANSGVLYVDPLLGSDSNAGTQAAPLATVSAAMRTKADAATNVVMLRDAVIPSFDLRATDASQTTQQLKILHANGFNVIIRDSGTDLSSVTWTQDGTYTRCWRVDLGAAGLGASQRVTRVLRTDALDHLGLPSQGFAASSASALDAAQRFGWYWDHAGRVLWVSFGSASTSVETNKAVLKPLYTNSAGTSRLFIYGSALALSGVTLEGVQIVTLDQSGRPGQMWFSRCDQRWSPFKGGDLTQCGIYVSERSTHYASAADGANALASSAVMKGLVVTVNSVYERTGDTRYHAVDGTLQGISCHGGSDHVSFGSMFFENNGQQVADTSLAGSDDVSWLVGCQMRPDMLLGSTTRTVLMGSAAASGSRKGYLDACAIAPGPALETEIAGTGELYLRGMDGIGTFGGSAQSY